MKRFVLKPVQGLGLGFMVQGLGFEVQDFGFRGSGEVNASFRLQNSSLRVHIHLGIHLIQINWDPYSFIVTEPRLIRPSSSYTKVFSMINYSGSVSY